MGLPADPDPARIGRRFPGPHVSGQPAGNPRLFPLCPRFLLAGDFGRPARRARRRHRAGRPRRPARRTAVHRFRAVLLPIARPRSGRFHRRHGGTGRRPPDVPRAARTASSPARGRNTATRPRAIDVRPGSAFLPLAGLLHGAVAPEFARDLDFSGTAGRLRAVLPRRTWPSLGLACSLGRRGVLCPGSHFRFLAHRNAADRGPFRRWLSCCSCPSPSTPASGAPASN